MTNRITGYTGKRIYFVTSKRGTRKVFSRIAHIPMDKEFAHFKKTSIYAKGIPCEYKDHFIEEFYVDEFVFKKKSAYIAYL